MFCSDFVDGVNLKHNYYEFRLIAVEGSLVFAKLKELQIKFLFQIARGGH